ncbi:MAG: single-stranded-DNA-specific exonuclease RecJ [Candidatus Schekmanbacteria bacterium]|nr:single-stranded-DNA-specific exonuclease RecJ [Candidatus Schekmanbacteria bacterium]
MHGQLLVNRGLRAPADARAFLNPEIGQLHDPFALTDMRSAVDILCSALRERRRICVHGDFDVDGITSTALLVRVLRMLGGDVTFFLPDRFTDGYGITVANVDRIADSGSRVLIAADCGTTAISAVRRARERGLQVLILDHHLPEDTLPEASALVNPRRPDCRYPDPNLCTAGLAVKLLHGVLLAVNAARIDAFLRSLLKIAAIGTVADVVPLRGENRVIASIGLRELARPANAGLAALLRVAGLAGREITEYDIAFRIAPRLNAIGRLAHAGPAVDMLLSDDADLVRVTADAMERLNVKRQAIQGEVTEEAMSQVETRRRGPELPHGLVVHGRGWHRGVVGIVAAKLVERYHRPSLVLAVEGDQAQGSGRSIPGLNLVAALRQCQHHLTRFGGHAMAVGLALPVGAIDEFVETFELVLAQLLPAGPEDQALEADAAIELAEVDADLADFCSSLGPFGLGNSRPTFLAAGLRLTRPPRVAKDKHLRLWVGDGAGRELEAMAFGMASRQAELDAAVGGFSALFSVAWNVWAGRRSIQLQIGDFMAPSRGES